MSFSKDFDGIATNFWDEVLLISACFTEIPDFHSDDLLETANICEYNAGLFDQLKQIRLSVLEIIDALPADTDVDPESLQKLNKFHDGLTRLLGEISIMGYDSYDEKEFLRKHEARIAELRALEE